MAMKSSARGRWLKVGGFAKKVAAMARMLQQSKALGTPGLVIAGAKARSAYMDKLRAGVKHQESVMRALGAKSQAAIAAEEAERWLASGDVVTTVESRAELEELEMWQQGDASLSTREKMLERQALRHDRRVLEALQAFWEAAQRSMQSGGDASASTLHKEGHAIMLRRVYRVMIRNYDPVEAERAIEEDWRNDTKGADVLTRKRFCDSFFELAVRFSSVHAIRLMDEGFVA